MDHPPYLNEQGRLTAATVLLLHAVTGVPVALLEACQVRSAERNWLRFPWYRRTGKGGAIAVVDRIHVSSRFFQPAGADTGFLLLLAHEAGHLLHAREYPRSTAGRSRFILWATGHYLRSLILHGNGWHRKARIEQEAERGRWVLRGFLAEIGHPAANKLLGAVRKNDAAYVEHELAAHARSIERLHRDYPGWA